VETSDRALDRIAAAVERLATAAEGIAAHLVAMSVPGTTVSGAVAPVPGAVIQVGSVAADQIRIVGLPDLKRDKVICWHGPNQRATRTLMDVTIARRGAAIVGPLDFGSATDVAKMMAKVMKGERQFEYYHDKSDDEGGKQVHILLRFDMMVVPVRLLDSSVRVFASGDNSIIWNLIRMSDNDVIEGVYVPDGPT